MTMEDTFVTATVNAVESLNLKPESTDINHALKITREEMLYKMSVIEENLREKKKLPQKKQFVFLFCFALMLLLGLCGMILVSAGQLAHPLETGSTPGWPAYKRLFAGDGGMNWFGTIYGSNAAPAFADLDAAAARSYDLVIGYQDGTVKYFRNDGQSIPSTAWLENSSNATGAPISPNQPTATYGMPAVADLNGDGKLDLAIGIRGISGTDAGNITFWNNTGTSSTPQWTHVTSWWSVSVRNTTDSASPGFTNYSRGNKWDLVVGNKTGVVYVQTNTGNSTNPAWNPLKITLMQIGGGNVYAKPAMADTDLDGDWDLVVGLANGSVFYFTNDTASWTFRGQICNLSNFSDTYAAPSFYDIDRDNDSDLLVGSGSGYVYTYLNNGTNTSPTWTYANRTLFNAGTYAVPAPGDFNGDGNVDLLMGTSGTTLYYYTGYPNASEIRSWSVAQSSMVGSVGSNAKPTLIDFDNDGDLDMFVGGGDGYVKYYRNDGTTSSPSWTFVRNFLNAGTNASPAFGDFNGDGNYEMIVGNASATLTRYDNVPKYNFNGMSPQWVGDVGNFSSAALVDIDNDGDLDAFAGNSNGNVYFIENFRNSTNPLWSDEPVLAVTISSTYAAPAFADIDGDGDYDMFVGRGDGNVDFYRNDGTATSPSWTPISPSIFPYDIGNRATPAFADIDGDGDLDLAVGTFNGSVMFYNNTGTAGNASWSYGGIWFNVAGSAKPAFADMDADGDYDLIVGRDNGNIFFYNNTGNATSPSFTYQTTWFDVGNGDNYATPSAGDLDGDGDFDLVVGEFRGWVRSYENNGTTATPSWNMSMQYWLGNVGSWSHAEFVDFDGDGDKDAVVGRNTDSTTSYITYYRNDGGGRFTEVMNWTSTTYLDGNFISPAPSLADMDADGDLDMVWGYQGYQWGDPKKLNFFENVANKASYNWTQMTTDFIGNGTFGNGNAAPFFTDFDGDGDLDIVLGSNDGWVRYFRNDGNATKANYTYVKTWFNVGANSCPAIADLTNDGFKDAIVGDNSGSYLYYFRNDVMNSGVNWTLNTSNFLGVIRNTETMSAFGDLNGDGKQDMIIGMTNGSIMIYINNGTNTSPSMTPAAYLGAFGTNTAPELVDLDNDGDLDLLFGNNSAYIGYFRNDGNSTNYNFTFVTSQYLPESKCIVQGSCGYTYGDPHAIDIDNDGDLDLVISTNSNMLVLWRNTGSASGPIWTYVDRLVGDDGSNWRGDFADINSDGTYDFIGGRSDGTSYFYRNTGTPSSPAFDYVYAGDLGNKWIPNVGSGRTAPTFVDLDGDGRKDLVVGNTSGYFLWYKNNGFYSGVQRFNNPTWIRSTIPSNQLLDYINVKSPSLGDLDNDGDIDILLGVRHGWATYGADAQRGEILYIRNDGTPSSPSFTYVGEIFTFTTNDALTYYPRPGLYDIDGDGDLDIAAGTYDGRVQYVINTGTPTSYAFKRVYAGSLGQNWLKTDVGDLASAALADVNNDSTVELFVGNTIGYIYQFNNSGIYPTAVSRSENPAWIWNSTSYAGASALYQVPQLVDADSDGDYDLVVGESGGGVYFFNNTGTNATAAWASAVNWLDVGDYSAPAMTDLNGDGKMDLFVGDALGNTKYYTNAGNFSWKYVYAGQNGTTYVPNVGFNSNPAIVDINNDNTSELCVSNTEGTLSCLRNYGLYSTDQKKADNAVWVLQNGSFLGNYNHPGDAASTNGVPAIGDLNGDGMLDLVIGSRNSASTSAINLWKNNGTKTNPSWVWNQTLISNGGNSYLAPTLADFDNDGDLDLAVGNSSGAVVYFKNQENPQTVLVLLRNAAGTPVSGATVSFSNQTSTVCSGVVTGSDGVAMCNMPNPGENITLQVIGASAGGTVQVDAGIPECQGHASTILDTTITGPSITLKKMNLNVYTPVNALGDSVRVLIQDYATTVFRGRANGNGSVTAFLPEKYIVSKGEPWTQRRVTYDVSLLQGADYAHNVTFSDVYVPNAINISSLTDSAKFFKFGAALSGATDSQYRMYLVYPAVRAQKKYNITEYINTSFSFVGNVSVYYMGNWSCIVTPQAADSFNVTYFDCPALAGQVTGAGDWLVASYTVQAPPATDVFLVNGGGLTATYTFPAPTIRLYT